MSKGPGLFSDIGKKAKDLLTKDYITDQEFSVSTYSDTGVAITSTGKKKGVSTFVDVAAQDKYKYKNTLVDVKFDTNSNSATMSKGPGLFSDIGKKAKDLLTKDYITDQTFSVSTYSDAGVAITSTGKKKGVSTFVDVAAQDKYKYKNTLVDIKFDTNSNISTTFTFTDIVPSTKTIALLKFPDYDFGKVEMQYFHHHATLTTAVSLRQAPAVDVSATIGTHAITFGVEASYSTDYREFTNYSAGLSVVEEDWHASIIFGDKQDSITWSYVHYLDKLKKSASAAEITKRFLSERYGFTVGGSYAVDSLTMLKAKINDRGRLAALWRRELVPKSFLTMSCEFDTKALYAPPRFGLALSLKP